MPFAKRSSNIARLMLEAIILVSSCRMVSYLSCSMTV